MHWLLFMLNLDAMPADLEQYYGFTKFAIELNELNPPLKLLLPPTDTRLRVDQRYKIKTNCVFMHLNYIVIDNLNT